MTRSTSFARGFLTAFLLAGVLAALAAPALYAAGAAPSYQGPVSGVVISEFRARGPSLGLDEIIELYNKSPDPVNISGWSIWQSNATGQTGALKDADGNSAFPAGTILRPGQHFLAANDAYSGSVQPDWTYITGQITNNGGIALLNASNGIEDEVGMSTGSAYVEGSPLAPWTNAINTDESYERLPAGGADDCTDTDRNANDFDGLVPSDPQNMASPLSWCGNPVQATTTTIVSLNPAGSAPVGQAVRVNFEVTAPSGTPDGGNVTVRAGADSCSGPLNNGQGNCNLAFTSAGSKSVTASYGGHAAFGASAPSAAFPYQVTKADPVVTILSDIPDPSSLSQAVTVVVKVSPQPGDAGTPTGTVTVIVETTPNSCTATLSGGQGQCVLHFGGSGNKSLHAEYQGDDNFNAGISPSVPHTVLPGPTNTSRPPTATHTLPPGFSVIINEIAWAGTDAFETDEWIELYNVTGSAINLDGWRLRALDGEPNITLRGAIPARGFFLLERGHDTTVSDIPADQLYSGALSDTVERLYLYNPAGGIADYANTYGLKWLAGSTSGNRSMERRGPFYDSPTTWVTNTGVVRNGKDAHDNPINGTPKRPNWATTVTLTPSPRPTIFPSRTLPPQPRPVINEFLPRAAYDWNKDGRVDVFDEFIEVANLGPVDVNLQGWRLDDEANSGSAPFSLPSMVLKPGDRAIFYGSQTNILLSDGGDTVRLLSPSNVIFDAQTYPVVTVADQTWCRLPDQRGSWYSDCFPTPNLPNQRRGELPSMPPGTGLEEPLCLLADTLPQEFILAECRGFGEDMFSARYWDRLAAWSEYLVRQNGSKWESFVQ